MSIHKSLALCSSFLLSLTLISGAILSSPSASADASGTVNITVTVPTSCSLALVNGTNNVENLSASINPGTSGLIGTSVVKALCNDPNGLAIYAVGYGNDTYGETNLTHNVDNTLVIPTGAATSPTNSQWNMTLAATTGDYTPTIVNATTGDNPVGNFLAPHVIPEVYTKIAYRNSATDVDSASYTATGANFTASFNAYIAPTQPAGVYEGKVKFLLVHPNVLTYNEQTGQPATTQPSTLPRDPEAILYLQDVSTWGDTVALEETVEAIDRRDGQTYKVKRLKMNAAGTQSALWMSNLNLGAEELVVDELDNTNTNLDSGVSPVAKSTLESWLSTTNVEFEIVPLTTSNSSNGRIIDDYGNKYGTTYGISAASAGTWEWEDTDEIINITSDLCPSGWRLPNTWCTEIGNWCEQTAGDFHALGDAYDLYSSSGLTTLQNTLGFSLAGTGSIWHGNRMQGEGGFYWSSYIYKGEYDSMEFSEEWGFSPVGGWLYNFNEAGSIRCIAQ